MRLVTEIMVSQFLQFFLFALILSSLFSMQDSFDKFFPSSFKPPSSLFNGQIKLDKYLSAQELGPFLQNMSTRNQDIVKVLPIGTSSFDRKPIWAVEITENVQKERELLKPMFKFVANVHGDETVGYALMVSLIQYLVYMYKNKDERVKEILEKTDVWIIPTLNPDGLSRAKEGQCTTLDTGEGKLNGQGEDIDTDFNHKRLYRNRETNSIVKFLLDENHPFVLSGNLQGGDIVASSPPIIGTILDSYTPDQIISWSLAPDSRIFEWLASEYVQRSLMMSHKKPCDKEYTNGFTNYWRDRNSTKGMQDFNYIDTNCFELNLELSCCKYPHSKDLPYYWHANLDAMLNFIDSTRQGVYGVVLNTRGRPIQKAVIIVSGNKKSIKVTKRGEYWRLLSPGRYNISAIAPGYKTDSRMRRVRDWKTYIRLDFTLLKVSVLPNFKSLVNPVPFFPSTV